jgi:hypothetical protein
MQRYITILIALFFLSTGIYADEVTFQATAPGTVVVGNPFYLQYKLNAEGDKLRPPVFDGFQQKAGPTVSTSSSTTFVNGKLSHSREYVYTYVLMGDREGTFTIAPATIEVKGKKYTSNAITIQVLKANQPEAGAAADNSGSAGISSSDLFLRASLSKTNVTEQEGILYTLKLYTRVSVVPPIQPDFPEFNGFLAFDISQDDFQPEQIENVNGINYRSYIIKQTLLFPQRSGDITIDQAKINLRVRMRTNRRSYNIFDDIFDTYQDVSKQLTSNNLRANVAAFPAGKPSGFKGLTGNYTLSSSISSTEVKTNDPVTLSITISGNGNLKMLATPTPEFPKDFEKYDPKETNNLKTTPSGVTGSRSFEYLVIPRFAGNFEIPSVKIPYFDPASKSYKLLSTPAYTLSVAKGADDNNNLTVTTFASKEDVKFIGQDIRFIKTTQFEMNRRGVFFMGSTAFWLWVIIPLVLYIFMLLLYRKTVRENADIALSKNKRANKVASRRLKQAARYKTEQKSEAFYDEVLRALWGYMSDKLNIPLSRLNKDNVQEVLESKKVEKDLIDSIIELLHTCEFARYAPGAVSGGMDETYATAEKIISQMDAKIKK